MVQLARSPSDGSFMFANKCRSLSWGVMACSFAKGTIQGCPRPMDNEYRLLGGQSLDSVEPVKPQKLTGRDVAFANQRPFFHLSVSDSQTSALYNECCGRVLLVFISCGLLCT